MSDYSELKRKAEACIAAGEYLPGEAWDEPRSYGKDELAFLEFVPVGTPAAVLALIIENERLAEHDSLLSVWMEKTEWVQATAQGQEFGAHRADVLRSRINQLKAENEALRKGLLESVVIELPQDLSMRMPMEVRHWIEKAGLKVAP